MDEIDISDNTSLDSAREPLLIARSGQLLYRAINPPQWLQQALRDTEYELSRRHQSQQWDIGYSH